MKKFDMFLNFFGTREPEPHKNYRYHKYGLNYSTVYNKSQPYFFSPDDVTFFKLIFLTRMM
jgi:hypothetical protein